MFSHPEKNFPVLITIETHTSHPFTYTKHPVGIAGWPQGTTIKKKILLKRDKQSFSLGAKHRRRQKDYQN